MAAGYLSAPGTKHGPCQMCDHRDCAHTRRMAAAVCRHCKKPIGYDVGFFMDPTDPKREALVHALCEYEDAEK